MATAGLSTGAQAAAAVAGDVGAVAAGGITGALVGMVVDVVLFTPGFFSTMLGRVGKQVARSHVRAKRQGELEHAVAAYQAKLTVFDQQHRQQVTQLTEAVAAEASLRRKEYLRRLPKPPRSISQRRLSQLSRRALRVSRRRLGRARAALRWCQTMARRCADGGWVPPQADAQRLTWRAQLTESLVRADQAATTAAVLRRKGEHLQALQALGEAALLDGLGRAGTADPIRRCSRVLATLVDRRRKPMARWLGKAQRQFQTSYQSVSRRASTEFDTYRARREQSLIPVRQAANVVAVATRRAR
jgi:hypothetical protein